jgi:NAD(P)-dependent dehydrogenase (short-subunit alcohol dehydrogenase family)
MADAHRQASNSSHGRKRVAVLDGCRGVALSLGDWSQQAGRCEVHVLRDGATTHDELTRRLGIDHRKEVRLKISQTIAARRCGLPGETADTCAFPCGAQASYVSGQSIQLDAGSSPGLI